MDRKEVIGMLNKTNREKPNLFKGMAKADVLTIQEEWIKALAKYSAEEFLEEYEAYPFPRLTGYKSQILADIVEGMEEERHRAEAMERYKKSLERIRLPEVEVQQTERIIDCATCTEPDRQFCGGGICMKLLGGR